MTKSYIVCGLGRSVFSYFPSPNLVTDLKNKEEEVVLKVDKVSLEEKYHTPESSIPDVPPTLHHSSQLKAEETVLQLEKQSLTEDDYHTPESSVPSRPSTLHHSTQSGVSKASGISEQGDIQYVPPLPPQGTLSPIAEAPSPDVESSPTIQAVYYPLQHILHPLHPVCG